MTLNYCLVLTGEKGLESGQYTTKDEARRNIVDYIEMFYNSRRQLSYLGYVSPKEFEKRQLLEKAD